MEIQKIDDFATQVRLLNIISSNNKMYGHWEDQSISGNDFSEVFLYLQALAVDPNPRQPVMGTPQKKIIPYPSKTKAEAKRKSIKLVVNDKDFSYIGGILKFVFKDQVYSEKEKALLLYRFVVKYRVSTATSTAIGDFSYTYPPATLTYFSGGDCVWSSSLFSTLCWFAGLKVRFYLFNGVHAFPEVWFDKKWHIIDPDGELFYPDSVAGSEFLDLATIRKKDQFSTLDHVKSSKAFDSHAFLQLKSVLTGSRQPDAFYEGKRLGVLSNNFMKTNGADISFDLLPGEKVTLFYDLPWYWVSLRESVFPKRKRTILLDQFDISESIGCGDAFTHAIEVSQNPLQETVRICATGKNSIISFPVTIRRPLIDGFLYIKGEGLVNEKDISLQCRMMDETEFRQLSAVDCNYDGVWFSLRRLFFDTPVLSQAEIALVFNKPVDRLKIRVELICELSPFSLPELMQGANRVSVFEDGVKVEDPDFLMEYTYDPQPTSRERKQILPIFPMNMVNIKKEAMTGFRWTQSAPNPEDVSYELLVSMDKKAIIPLAPNFLRIVKGNELRLQPQDSFFLKKGRLYFWQIREMNANGFFSGNNSEIISFTLI